MKRQVLLAIMLMFTPGLARATDRADQLLWRCNGTAKSKGEAVLGKAICAGYLCGFLDAYQVAATVHKTAPLSCLPPTGISNDQAIRVVVTYLEAHPQELHETARSSVFLALRAAFPCKS